jgi:hypothetical protein
VRIQFAIFLVVPLSRNRVTPKQYYVATSVVGGCYTLSLFNCVSFAYSGF